MKKIQQIKLKKNSAEKYATDSLTTLSVATLHWTTLPPHSERAGA